MKIFGNAHLQVYKSYRKRARRLIKLLAKLNHPDEGTVVHSSILDSDGANDELDIAKLKKGDKLDY